MRIEGVKVSLPLGWLDRLLTRPRPIRKGERFKLNGTWFQVDDIFQTGMLLRLVNKRMTMEQVIEKR